MFMGAPYRLCRVAPRFLALYDGFVSQRHARSRSGNSQHGWLSSHRGRLPAVRENCLRTRAGLGSEALMIVNCVAYQEGRKIADISKEAISDYLKRSDCFVWVALHDATAEELEEMRDEFDLHELAVED